MRLFFAVAFATAALHTGAVAAPMGVTGADEVVAAPKLQQSVVTKGLARPGAMRSSHAKRLALPAPATEVSRLLRRPSKGTPLHIGVQRAVPELDSTATASSALAWERLADASMAASIQVTSPTAQAVRIALRVEELPSAAIVRFQDVSDGNVFEVAGSEIWDALARNQAGGQSEGDARLYWSPLVQGDSIRVEIELPAGADPRAVRVALPQISHLATSAAKDFVLPTKSASCEVDAMCFASQWSADMNAVARMVFTDSTGTYLCTGTLLADQDATTQLPYFLSANHCISTQTLASSLTTFWFYRASACNSASIGPYQQLAGGATLLYATTATDTSFMRLVNTPPVGAVFAGWATTAQGTSTSVTGLHHPLGDWLKISAGGVAGYLNCTAPSSGSFNCSGAAAGSSSFYDVQWTSGITEPGSSGSGLFRADGSLVGQLYGGSTSCGASGAPSGDDVYGRFDVAYNAGLSRWLSGQRLTVMKSGAGSGTVASNPSGIACGATCADTFTAGSSVTLTATAGSGSLFTGWSGGICSGTGSCVVNMTSAQSVTASFSTASAILTVNTTGSGTVTSQPSGIACGATCSAGFPIGTNVTLSATPAQGMVFGGWSGACSGTANCVVTVNGATSAAAMFITAPSRTTATSVSSSANPSSAGNTVTFTANVGTVAGAPTGTVAFIADGGFISGCASQLVLGGVASCSTASIAAGNHAISAAYSGDSNYDPSTSSTLTQVVSGNTPAQGGRLFGLSTRMQVLTGNDVLIAGFVVSGSSPKTVVVRARGPSLLAQGLSGVLLNPALTIVPASGAAVMTNDDWGTAPNAAQLSATGFAPGDPRESALLVTLDPGAYTAIVSGAGNTTGLALVEVYEIDHPDIPLSGISTRGQVQGGSSVMIGGFVIQGSGPQTVILRARGPSLAGLGITPLANPMLYLYAGSTLVASNDDWGTAPNAAQMIASGFAPGDPRESAILVTLDPGAYTAIVTGAGNTAGTGIVEVYAQ